MGEETEPTAVAEGVTADEPSSNPRRKRKKLLHKSLLELMEFYLGDANLKHDKFLNSRIQGKPFVYIDLSVFLTFNRVKALTTDVKDLVKSIKHSEFLQLSEDETQVCRLTPIKKKENEDECTIYVEQLGPDVNHEVLTKVFSEFGPVDYISMPKYSHNGKFKGFAFVEFRDADCAKKALELLSAKGCCLSPHMAPEELVSVKTFDTNDRCQNKQEKSKVNEKPSSEKSDETNDKKPSQDKESSNIKEGSNKKVNKRKLDETDNKSTGNDSSKGQDGKEPEEKKIKLENEETAESEESESSPPEDEIATDSTKQQKKRKRKKKLKKDRVTASSLGLRVLSKHEWKQLRNKYLNMQREVMTLLKQQLRRPKYEMEDVNAKVQCKPGTIIKVTLEEPIANATTAKTEFRVHPEICYVDASEGCNLVYLRTTSPELASSLIQTKHWPVMEIIQGEDEAAYLDKIKLDREKLNQKKQKTKQRGRTKLLKRAENFLEKQM